MEKLYHQWAKVVQKKVVTCKKCGRRMKFVEVANRFGKDSWPAEGLTLEDIADTPMHFTNRDDLRKYCRQTGLTCGALL